LLHIVKVILLALFLIQYFIFVQADNIDEFIENIHVSTFDCPSDEFIPQVDNYPQQGQLKAQQLISLRVFKVQWLICMGNNAQAKVMPACIINWVLFLTSMMILRNVTITANPKCLPRTNLKTFI
jgi:hypothetical protein